MWDDKQTLQKQGIKENVQYTCLYFLKDGKKRELICYCSASSELTGSVCSKHEEQEHSVYQTQSYSIKFNQMIVFN